MRSARDYFVELARGLGGVLVHDGGSPAAVADIARTNTQTFNAFDRGELFSRAPGRSAPYNLYSSGGTLREAVNRLSLGPTQVVEGDIYRPSDEADEAAGVSVRFSGWVLERLSLPARAQPLPLATRRKGRQRRLKRGGPGGRGGGGAHHRAAPA